MMLLNPNDAPDDGVDENELRETPEVIDRLGPEDATAEEVMQGMDDYGYNRMTENYYPSAPVTESDEPDNWLNEDAQERTPLAHDADTVAEEIEEENKE